MTRKLRIGIVVTALWVTLFLLFFVFGHHADRPIFAFLMIIPPMIGWGIWWIRKS